MHLHACDDCGEEFDCLDDMCAKAYEWDKNPESDYWGEANFCSVCRSFKTRGVTGIALMHMEA